MYSGSVLGRLHLIRDLVNPCGQKLDPSVGCFGSNVLALSVQKHIFLKTKKADQKHCENWRRESGSKFHKASPMCERGEWRKQLRDFITQSLKQSPLGSGTISSIFGPNGIHIYMESYLFYVFYCYLIVAVWQMCCSS